MARSFAACFWFLLLGGAPLSAQVTCSSPGSPISSTLPVTTDTLDVPDVLQISDTTISLTITHSFVGHLDIVVTSPAATAVQVHDGGGGADDDILVSYNDAGVPNGPPYDAGSLMQPSGPGQVADYDDEGSLGTWTIAITDNLNGDDGTLDEWCVDISGCPVLPPTGLSCTSTGELAWTNPQAYDSIDIERDGVVLATLAGSATNYTDPSPGIGAVEYRVIGNDLVLACGSGTSCAVLAAITDLVWAHPDQQPGPTDNAAGIIVALTNNGVTGIQLLTQLPADLSVYERVWVVLGTFGINHQLTPDEGQILRDFCLDSNGRLYVTGSDPWGFDPQTPFDDVDGVDPAPATLDGVNGCDITTLTGLDSGQGLNLDEFTAATIGDNNGECAWVDELAVDFGGAAMFNDFDSGNVITYHDGMQSTTPFPGDYRVICQSFEFATFGDQAARDALMAEFLNVLGGGAPSFVRGDFNNDGTFSGIPDGLFGLFAGFVPGAPQPTCLDAADADGNGDLLTLVDSLFVLNAAFAAGSPFPPPPFPNCGVVPSVLGCAEPNPACNP